MSKVDWIKLSKLVKDTGWTRSYFTKLIFMGEIEGHKAGSHWSVKLSSWEAYNERQLRDSHALGEACDDGLGQKGYVDLDFSALDSIKGRKKVD